MRTFKATEQVNPSENVVNEYKGFDRNFTPSTMDEIVLTMCEGEIDVYVLDPTCKNAATELVRFLTNQAEAGFCQETIVGRYQRK